MRSRTEFPGERHHNNTDHNNTNRNAELATLRGAAYRQGVEKVAQARRNGRSVPARANAHRRITPVVAVRREPIDELVSTRCVCNRIGTYFYRFRSINGIVQRKFSSVGARTHESFPPPPGAIVVGL